MPGSGKTRVLPRELRPGRSAADPASKGGENGFLPPTVETVH